MRTSVFTSHTHKNTVNMVPSIPLRYESIEARNINVIPNKMDFQLIIMEVIRAVFVYAHSLSSLHEREYVEQSDNSKTILKHLPQFCPWSCLYEW